MPLIELLALISLQPSTATTVGPTQPALAAIAAAEADEIDRAYELIKAGKGEDAFTILDALIARSEKQYANDRRQIFSSRSLGESLIYTSLSQKIGKDVLVLNEDWATAHFLKGFALIDMNRSAEAKPQLDRAIALAPMNAQFLNERGEWYKSHKDWAKKLFKQSLKLEPNSSIARSELQYIESLEKS